MMTHVLFARYGEAFIRDICRILLLSSCIVIAVCSSAWSRQNTPRTLKGRQPARASLEKIVEGAIGPFSAHSDGYGNPGASGLGYISVVTLHTGQVLKQLSVRGQRDEGLDGTVAFDRAEASGAYIGQINLIVASSFSGINGAIWGYDIAKSADLMGQKDAKLFDVTTTDARIVPVYSVEPLLDAGARLFGTRDNPKFPILPGAHVIAAHKGINAAGPTNLWCGVAIGIAENRSVNANLIMELCGEFNQTREGESDDRDFDKVRKNLAKSILRVGENQNASYKEIFVGVAHETIRDGYVGYAMVTVPFIVLAKNAVPAGRPENLLKMKLTDWEKAVTNGHRQ
jgi:histidine decarboxylase